MTARGPAAWSSCVAALGVACGVLAMLSVRAAAAPPALVLHVAPDGNDAWSGTPAATNAGRTDGPLASLDGARQAIRRIKSRGSLQQPVRVLVADGTYRIVRPIVFEHEDGGTETCPVVYEAADGARPVFSGGVPLAPLSRERDSVAWLTVAHAGGHMPPVEHLWVNNRRAIRARSPNDGYFYMAPLEADAPPASQPCIPVRRGDLAATPDLAEATVVAYHSWESSRHRVVAFDSRLQRLVLTRGAVWPFQRWGIAQRYIVENTPAALDAPGEWHVDRAGALRYLPREGETMSSAAVVAPAVTEFIRITGRADAPVQHLTFRGLAFHHAGWTMPREGHSDAQAAATVPAVITADFARHVSFDQCEIAHTATHALWFRRGCRENVVEHCRLHDLGAGGVRIGETTVQPAPLRTSGNVVRNNIIRSCGHVFPGAVGVWIGQSGGNLVAHNDIADLRYSGISVGWRWGYGESLATANRIEFNRIHHVGRGVLSDLGGIYTLGPSPGTVLRGNVIHDVRSYDHYGRGGWGIYNDEGSSEIRVEQNLVHHTSSGGYHLHYGRDNHVVNNIFAFGVDAQLQLTRAEPHRALTFERNIIVWERGDPLAGRWLDADVAMGHNVYWCTTTRSPPINGLSFADWQARGRDDGSLCADPGLLDPLAADARLKPDSAAARIGFRSFNAARAGVFGDAEWKARAAEPVEPDRPVVPPPPDPPLLLDEGFETTAVGERPRLARCEVEGRGDAIVITDALAAQGRRCLKLIDALGLASRYNPHFSYSPNHTNGRTRLRFDVRMEPDAVLVHEWRDDAPRYRVGPRIRIANGHVHAGARDLLEVPPGRWVRLEITAELGSSARGMWSLRVTPAGGAPRTFDHLPYGSPDWKSLSWLGFIADADAGTFLCLDNLRLTHQADRP